MTSGLLLLNQYLAANRRAAYLAGTSCSVGRGCPKGHLLPDNSFSAQNKALRGTDLDHRRQLECNGILNELTFVAGIVCSPGLSLGETGRRYPVYFQLRFADQFGRELKWLQKI